ncbi:MAG TPA: proton-conducting transporter membrane subunit, partial [Chroococcales cyanobacterium]
PLYALSSPTLHLVLAVGLVTMISGKCMMLSRNDIKKTLGYSTIGQMGYMIMECGLGAFSLAVFHLIAHGLFKATVFLNCGDVIHKARLDPERPPQPSTDPGPGIAAWATGLVLSLLLPLAIIIGTHHALGLSFLNPQAVFIFVLFSWVTAAHGTLTLFRLGNRLTTIMLMVAAVSLVSVVYFFCAEQFTHFLYPDSAAVASYFSAAALPHFVFLGLAALLISAIVVSWSMLYLRYHDKIAIRSGRLWSEFYLFFINRLYLDAIAFRLFESLKRAGKTVDRSRSFLFSVVLLAVACASVQIASLPGGDKDSVQSMALLFVSALLMPLFPLHGVYVAALTRLPRLLAIASAVVLPAAGIFLVPHIPHELLPAIGTLSAFGVLWGSVKAFMQVDVFHLLAYAGLASYSVLWWHLAQVGAVTPEAQLYALQIALVTGGLTLAWDRLCVRYGNLDLNRIGGLFKPMPRFGLCVALLVMAAVGLPPFGLFFSYLGILLSPSSGMSLGLIAVIAGWFAASWYMFKQLMQRLLFGPHRSDIRYEDLRPAEIAVLMVFIVLLALPGSIPQRLLSTHPVAVTSNNGGAL